MTPTAESIAVALGGRKYGRQWKAKCPAHEDKHPSLDIMDSPRDGRVLFICRTGCPQRDVLAALRARGLWPERQPFTAAERQAWATQRRAVEVAAIKLDNWRAGAWVRLADTRIEAATRGNIADGARELYLLTSAGAAEVARIYASAEPKLRAQDEAAGRRWRTLCEKLCAWVVARTRETLPDARSTS